MTFRLPKHNPQKRRPGNEASSKPSPTARRLSKNTPDNSSDASDSKAKHSNLLKSEPKPASATQSVKDPRTNKSNFTEKQENSLHSGALIYPVSSTDTNTGLLKSTSHTATHSQLTGDDQKDMISGSHTKNLNASSEYVTPQRRNFPLHYTYSAAQNYTAKSTGTKLNISTNTGVRATTGGDPSLLCTPRNLSASTPRELLTENHNDTKHHSTQHTLQNTNASIPTPERLHACSNTPTASKQALHTHHLITEERAEERDVSEQHLKNTYSYSAAHTHPSDLLPKTPAKNLTVPKPPSTPLTHSGTASHTPNPSDTSEQFSVPLNTGATPTPSRPPHQEKEKTPYSASVNSGGGEKTSAFVCTPQWCLDPVSSFMMLRGLLRFPVEKRPDKTPLRTTADHTSHGIKLTTVHFYISWAVCNHTRVFVTMCRNLYE